MRDADDRLDREDASGAFQRDVERYKAHAQERDFMHSLVLVGSVGWPIAGMTVGGALLGRYLDERFATGVRFTLMLLTVGACLGTFAAFRVLHGGQRS